MLFQFLKSRKESKWHLRIESVTDQSKAPTSPKSSQGRPIPPATLQTVTKAYLGKKKRTPEEIDAKLEKLITGHSGQREKAFAACAADLSENAINEHLTKTFLINPKSLQGLVVWLQVFISAAQSRSEFVSSQDRKFAIAVLPAAIEITAGRVQHDSIKAVFDAWRVSTPSNPLLLQQIGPFTQQVIRHIAKDLIKFQAEIATGVLARDTCTDAIRCRGILVTVSAAQSGIKTYLDQGLSDRSCWTAWRPNVDRLLRWSENPSNAPFNELLALEGPDLDSEPNQQCCSKWQALIRGGHLLPWLELKGWHPAIGLVTGDTEELLACFIDEFLEVASLSVVTKHTELLKYLITRDGLDSQPLKSWRAVESMLPSGGTALLLTRTTPFRAEDDALLIRCLGALSRDVTGAARRSLVNETAQAVTSVSKFLLGACNACDITSVRWKWYSLNSVPWMGPAQRLWQLRSAIDGAGWLHSSLDQRLVGVSRSQASEKSLEALYSLQKQLIDRQGLATMMVGYIRSYVRNGRCIADDATIFAKTLHDIWMNRPSTEARETALLIATLDGLSQETRISCVKGLQAISADQVQSLQQYLTAVVGGESLAIIGITEVIAALSSPVSSPSRKTEWTQLLRALIERLGISVQDEEFLTLGFATYRHWIGRLHAVLGGTADQLGQVHVWLKALQDFDRDIEALEKLPGSAAALRHIMTSYTSPADCQHLKMLRYLADQKNFERKTLMQNLYLMLRSSDITIVSQTLQSISLVSQNGFKSCQALLSQFRESREVALVRLTIWLWKSPGDIDTENALFNLGKLLKLVSEKDIRSPISSLHAAREYYTRRVAEIVETTQRLEQARAMLQRKDPVRVEAMMDELDLEHPRGVEELMIGLPAELLSFVDAIGSDEIELSFPLSDSTVNAMQRLALGLNGTETLSVHLRVANASEIDGFCVHVNENGEDADDEPHTFYAEDTPPIKSYCHGRPTRLTYLVSSALWHMMQTGRNQPIAMWYEVVSKVVTTSGSRCMICASSGSARLHRPTICGSQVCQKLWLSSDLETRISDLRTDGRAVDLLLAATFTTAAGGDLALLPNRPNNLSDSQRLINLLNSLPATNQLASAADLSKRIRRHGRRAEVLLSWACNSYRGFLVSAQGKYKIPSMPNVHQFLLVDACPEVESRFARHNSTQPRNILFHGTSLDRLYAILTEGLRNLSNTPLMKHGT